MAIDKYTTEGIVIEGYDQGEHDRVFKVFTKDFGLLTVHGRSIRKLESKLRAHVLPRSVTRLTIVRGKEVWRLTGAERMVFDVPHLPLVVELIKRFIKGESVNKRLYKRAISVAQLSHSHDQDKVRLLIYYVFLVELGYADAQVIGATTIRDYASYEAEDLYTHLLLNYQEVRNHTLLVLKEIQL